MTRKDQITIASCAYGSRGSCIDFEAGAKWADANPKQGLVDLSKFWHSNQEMPQQDIDEYGSGRDCLVEIKNSPLIEIGQVLFDDGIFAIACHLNTYAMDEVKRWAYVDELLPKKK